MANLLLSSLLIISTTAFAAPAAQKKPILSDIRLLDAVGVPILERDEKLGVGFATIDADQEARISAKAHEWKRCGGFELLPMNASAKSREVLDSFESLRQQDQRNQEFLNSKALKSEGLTRDARIASAVTDVKEENLKNWVTWFSSYPTRMHRSPQRMDAINALKAKLEETSRRSRFPVEISLVSHSSTPQSSLRARIVGSKRPNEIVVLGGHVDSVNQGMFGPNRSGAAPGADDNASGSANLLEALRIVLNQQQPERTIEFFWYAGEEAGLLGSAEIARSYKQANKDVIAVLQLDMTLHPGSGEFVLGSMTDFTSAWLRGILTDINALYVNNARVVDSRCGYGCSDHASWHKQGYPALMPFEATFDDGNKEIHTPRDVINNMSNFKHSAMFSKIAVAFAMGLGNSGLRAPN